MPEGDHFGVSRWLSQAAFCRTAGVFIAALARWRSVSRSSGCSVSSQIDLTWLMRDDREDFHFIRSDGHGLGVSKAMVSAADTYQG